MHFNSFDSQASPCSLESSRSVRHKPPCHAPPLLTAARKPPAGSPLTDFPNTPSGIEIRRKIAEVLRAAVKPEIKNGPAMLLKRWTEIQNAGPSKLLNKQLDIMWPLPPPAPPRG